jgi:hypothetical protein
VHVCAVGGWPRLCWPYHYRVPTDVDPRKLPWVCGAHLAVPKLAPAELRVPDKLPSKRAGEVPNTDSEPEVDPVEAQSVLCKRCLRRVGGRSLGLRSVVAVVRDRALMFHSLSTGTCLAIMAAPVDDTGSRASDLRRRAAISKLQLDAPVDAFGGSVLLPAVIDAHADLAGHASARAALQALPTAKSMQTLGTSTASAVELGMRLARAEEQGSLGHERTITAVAYGSNRVFTGAPHGCISVAWLLLMWPCLVMMLCTVCDVSVVLAHGFIPGSVDCTIRVWTLRPFKCEQVLRKHTSRKL